jgi:transposase
MHIGYWWESQKEIDQLGRPRRRWVDNIKMDLREIGCDAVDWIDMAQDRDQWRALVNTVLNLRVP